MGRQFLLRPGGRVRSVFGYLLALAAERHGVDVHCVVVMGNHYHAVVTDWDGRISDFLAWLHRLTAVVLNSCREREEAMWSSAKPSIVRLEGAGDTLAKMVYTIANPVAAGLVERAAEWAGLKTLPSGIRSQGGEDFERPAQFFRSAGGLPDVARLRFTKPPGFDELSDDEFAERLQRLVTEREKTIAAQLAASGRTVAGAARASQVHWSTAPARRAPQRGRVPHIAAREPERRLGALGRLATFRAEYAEALKRYRRGERDVVFPAGTYALRRRYRVRVHPPPRDICWSRGAGI